MRKIDPILLDLIREFVVRIARRLTLQARSRHVAGCWPPPPYCIRLCCCCCCVVAVGMLYG
eukprot:COSAG06_NODE_29979_length_547_cov_0.917411_1_plen_60_part_10